MKTEQAIEKIKEVCISAQSSCWSAGAGQLAKQILEAIALLEKPETESKYTEIDIIALCDHIADLAKDFPVAQKGFSRLLTNLPMFYRKNEIKPICKTCRGSGIKRRELTEHLENCPVNKLLNRPTEGNAAIMLDSPKCTCPPIPCPDCKDKTEAEKPEHDPTCECLNGKGVVFPCTCDYAERLKLFCEQQSEQIKKLSEASKWLIYQSKGLAEELKYGNAPRDALDNFIKALKIAIEDTEQALKESEK